MEYGQFSIMKVWQKAFELSEASYRLSMKRSKGGHFALADQMRRSALSVPSNISEGYRRNPKERRRFVDIARGSASELETQLMFTERLGLFPAAEMTELNELMKLVNCLLTLYRKYLTTCISDHVRR